MIWVYTSHLMSEELFGIVIVGDWIAILEVISSFRRASGKPLHCMFIYSYRKIPHSSESSWMSL